MRPFRLGATRASMAPRRIARVSQKGDYNRIHAGPQRGSTARRGARPRSVGDGGKT